MDGGMTMNILPGETACFRCICPDVPPQGLLQTCTDSGILGMASGIIGMVEAAEAVKSLLGDPSVRRTMLILDVWRSRVDYISIQRANDCPSCSAGRLGLLYPDHESRTGSGR
jgi:molybdopterin/thiamine biosynthesis adenylyltransferase